MEITVIICFVLLSYLFGSIPTAVWFGKAFYGMDVREHGSGNAGATNTLRVLGTKPGIAVLLVDALKGFSAANLMLLQGNFAPGTTEFRNMQLLLGTMAVVGHIFPLFASFKGGKGIATMLGMVIAVDYQLALLSVGVFILVLIVTEFVSLASITAVSLSPLFVGLLFNWHETVFMIFCSAAALVVIYTHRKNIVRLINGEENKTRLFKASRS